MGPRRDGWFMRRDIVDPAICARCRDLIWETPGSKADRMVREDRSTYVGPFERGEDGVGEGTNLSGYRWFPRRDVLAGDEAFVSVLSKNPRVIAIAEQLMGAGEVEELSGSSGVYGTMPMGDKSPKSPDSCHIDSYLDSRQRLSCVAYIDDVAVRPIGPSLCCCPSAAQPIALTALIPSDAVAVCLRSRTAAPS